MTSTTQNNKGIPLFLLFISMCEFSAIAQSCWHHISRGTISNHSILFIWQSWSFVKCDLVLLIHIGWHQIWIIFLMDWYSYLLFNETNQLFDLCATQWCHRLSSMICDSFFFTSFASLAREFSWLILDWFDELRFDSIFFLLSVASHSFLWCFVSESFQVLATTASSDTCQSCRLARQQPTTTRNIVAIFSSWQTIYCTVVVS